MVTFISIMAVKLVLVYFQIVSNWWYFLIPGPCLRFCQFWLLPFYYDFARIVHQAGDYQQRVEFNHLDDPSWRLFFAWFCLCTFAIWLLFFSWSGCIRPRSFLSFATFLDSAQIRTKIFQHLRTRLFPQ